jgi:hypothetical protein
MKIKKNNLEYSMIFFSIIIFGFFLSNKIAFGDAASLQICQQNCSTKYTAGSTQIVQCNLSCQQAENPNLTPSQICGQNCLATYDPSVNAAAFNSCENACTNGGSGTGTGANTGTGTSTGAGTGTTSGSGSAIGTQCTTQNTDGTESGCRNTNDQYILDSQCKTQYASNPSICSSMSAYLGQMQQDCNNTKPSGIDCSKISANNVYGSQASAFANYQQTNSTGATNTATTGQLDIPKNTGLADPAGGIGQILGNLLNWLLGIVGIIALIAFIISGLQYFMAAGNENTMQTAKRNMTYAIIGIIVALSGFIIIMAIDSALRANSINF